MISISDVFCAFIVSDARAKSFEIPRGGIRKDHGLRQRRCASVVSSFLRFENFLCEVFEAACGIGEIEFQRSCWSRGILFCDGRLSARRGSADGKKRMHEQQRSADTEQHGCIFYGGAGYSKHRCDTNTNAPRSTACE